MADSAGTSRARELLSQFLDRATFRGYVRDRTLTEDESVLGIALAERFFGAHHRNLACLGLYKIATAPTSGYSALPVPPQFHDRIQNVYKSVEVEPGQFEQVLHEGILLVAASNFTPCVLELKRENRGLWIRAWTRSQYHKLVKDLVDAVYIYCKKNNRLRGRKIDPQGRFLKVEKCGWEDLVLPEDVKAYLMNDVAQFVPRLHQFRQHGLKTKRGILLSGPPGAGKTLFGKVLANMVDSTFIWVTSRDLVDPSRVREVFRMARDLAPSILFFEDADLYAEDRRTGSRSAVLGEIFNQLDGLEPLEDVLTVMTTNYPEKLERALIDRPGRFDKEVRFDNPNDRLVLSMIRRFTRQYDLDASHAAMWEEVGRTLAGHSGAHVYEAVKRAVMRAIDDPAVGRAGGRRLQLPLSFLLDAAKEVRGEHREKGKRFEDLIEEIPDVSE